MVYKWDIMGHQHMDVNRGLSEYYKDQKGLFVSFIEPNDIIGVKIKPGHENWANESDSERSEYEDINTYRWGWEDGNVGSGQWKSYDKLTSDLIEDATSLRKASVMLNVGPFFSLPRNRTNYMVKFDYIGYEKATIQQINLKTNFKRNVKRVIDKTIKKRKKKKKKKSVWFLFICS